MNNCTSWYSVTRLFSACACFCTFECTVWRACKAPSRVRWYPKLHTLVFSVCFLPRGVRVRPLSSSVVPQNCTLSCSVCFFAACRIHDPRVNEKKSLLLATFEILYSKSLRVQHQHAYHARKAEHELFVPVCNVLTEP